jgi:cytochrome c oxidase cbb3-type subunit 3
MSTAPNNGPEKDFDGITERHGQRPPVYFMVLFFGLIVWGAIFMAFYLLSGWSSQAEFKEKLTAHQQSVATKPTTTPTGTEQVPVAAELFASHCSVCHGPAGKGGIGSDLTSSSFKYGRTVAAIRTSITDGRANGMPPFGTQLNQAQIGALADYVSSLK